jgi:predicted porin
MKKSLIALAVLGLSGAAMAQSSVTLYGVADAGVGKIAAGYSGDPSNAKYGRASTINGNRSDLNNKTQFISSSLMNNADSRVGVRGVEDLGGGLKVSFNFETGLDLDDGSQTNGSFWARQANVAIGGNWGTVKLGRQFTPSYLTAGMYDLTNQANYSVLGNTYKAAGIGNRANSAFAYITPTFYGVTAAVGYVSKNDSLTSGVCGGTAPTGVCANVWDVAVLYSNGPISAGLSVNKAGKVNGGALSSSKTNYQIGGKYTFANFAVAASYTQATDVAGAVGGNDPTVNPMNARRRGFGLGGSANFGPFTATVDLTRDIKNQWASGYRVDNAGVVSYGKKWTNGVVELKYALSKRTFLYGAYLRQDGTNNYGLGMRHNF